MGEHNIDFFGISETNVNTHCSETYRTLSNQFKKTIQQRNATMTAYHTRVPWTSQYKPGGIITLINESLTAHTTSRSIDQNYERWINTKIGSPRMQIVIITAYMVCKTEITPLKDKTAAYQQWLLMSKHGITGHPQKITS